MLVKAMLCQSVCCGNGIIHETILIALNVVNSANKVTGVLNAFKNLRHLLTQRNVALKVPLAQQMNQTSA